MIGYPKAKLCRGFDEWSLLQLLRQIEEKSGVALRVDGAAEAHHQVVK